MNMDIFSSDYSFLLSSEPFFTWGQVPTGYCFTVLCYLPWAGGSHSNQLQQCVLVPPHEKRGPGGGRTHASHVMTSITPAWPHRPFEGFVGGKDGAVRCWDADSHQHSSVTRRILRLTAHLSDVLKETSKDKSLIINRQPKPLNLPKKDFTKVYQSQLQKL